MRYFDTLSLNAKCELTYNSDHGFLLQLMLSAQCTDNKANKLTPIFFSKYKSLEELDKASLSDLEEIIKPLGLYKNKAANIKSITHDLLTKFNGSVPKDKKDLMSLSGVGNKTANVVRIELFKEKEFPVDTHVKRVANRLGLSNSEDVNVIEKDLRNTFSDDLYIKLHHQFIFFGRYKCKAISPICKDCHLKKYCHRFKK